jgi:hypothetical protein
MIVIWGRALRLEAAPTADCLPQPPSSAAWIVERRLLCSVRRGQQRWRRSPNTTVRAGHPGKSMSDLHEDVLAISPDIRYVAAAHGQQVQMRSRHDLHNASSTDSDLYEELLVNPTLLTLTTQRGNINCGGLRYLIVGYGHFHQLVIPSPAGHVSVAFELGANPADHLQAILRVMAHHGQPAV